MTDFFKSLEDAAFFLQYVSDHFDNAATQWLPGFSCTNTVDRDRITLAHGEYMQHIKTFSVLLQSENPDQYKRAGALLHALYKSQIITLVLMGNHEHGTLEDFEEGAPVGYSYHDCQHILGVAKFYQDHYNELLSFDLAYLCCAAYEEKPTNYDFSYLNNMCHYLCKNKDLSADSFSMIFRSLMHRSA